ncbi:MAG: type II toxin-antitoxin system HipA family toxin [Paludibacteraceae bacterium]|nr:type II toxin-antitoxin system HipA family toxin [Paludibacteraceae bacterium]
MKRVEILDVVWKDVKVGRLTLTKDGVCAFEYTPEYLSMGISISPFELPLQNGIKIAKNHLFEGGFGVFDDSLPDGWGSLILDGYLHQKGINPRSLSLLDRLALVGTNGRGALEFFPDYSVTQNEDYHDFEKLAIESEKILSSEEYDGFGIEEFQRRGGSPGGARPKVFAKYEGKEWLVKFKAKEDSQNIGVLEYKYSLLAKKCRVEMPETRLFEGKYFGVERFDRTENGKLHCVSMAGLLCADYRIPSIDYLHIFKVCNALTHNSDELWKVYRLMVFNYLIGNKDDHAKNFSFLNDGKDWRFAPAYDLLPSYGMNGFHTTSINDKIEPTSTDLIEVAKKSGLKELEAKKIFEEIQEIVSLEHKNMTSL